MTKSRRKKSYIFTFLVILLIGSAGVFLTKTDVGFTIVYKVLRQQIDTRLKSTFSIRELKTPERMSLEANYLQFANEDSSIVITVDTVNINYRGIFELLGRRHVDSLYLVDPKIYLRLKEPSYDSGNLPDITFPNLLVNTVRIENADFRIETPDTLIDQTIDQLKFHYSGRKDGAELSICNLELSNTDLDVNIRNLTSEVVVKNRIAKLHNLNFMLNESKISSNGKIRFMEPFRFQFKFNIKDLDVGNYVDLPVIKENDLIDLNLDVMGDFKAFTATVDLNGKLNDKMIDQASFNLEYKDDYLHILQANLKNPTTDLSIYGSYGLKDKYLSATVTSYDMDPAEWIGGTLSHFGFQGRLRAVGYLEDRVKVNYDFDCTDLYGLDKTTLSGNVILYGFDDIRLDSTNYIYLPDGVLKARGRMTDLANVDLDIYGDINSLGNLDIPKLGDLKADDIYLTLKVLGDIKDPDIQMNFNLDSLKYDDYKINNLNVSLYSNKTISEPGGAVLVSFENASIDSFLIGSVQTYVRVVKDMIYLDYLDMDHDNYHMSMSGSIRDFKDFSIKTMKGQYLGEDVYLLDPVRLTVNDHGFTLSRFDVLYRDALLYGSLDVREDSLEGSLNIAGAELNSLPLISTWVDSITGLLDMNIDISGALNAPKIKSNLSLKKAHAFGLDARRIRSTMNYADQMVTIQNFNIDIANNRHINMIGNVPLSIDFTSKKPVNILPQDSLYAEIEADKVRLSKLLPFILDLHILGDTDMKGIVTGTVNDPIMDADMFVSDPVVMKINGDSIKTKFHYSDERMYFNDVHIFANNGYYQGDANFFLDLRFQPEAERFIADSSIYVYVQGTDDELIYLTPFIDPMESFNGEVFTELEMKGNFNKTIKNGKVTIKNGHLVLGILGNEIVNLDGEAVMTDNQMKVDLKGKLPSVAYTLAGVLGLENTSIDTKHNFDITGNMNMRYLIRPQFDLNLTGEGLSIITLDENVNLTTGAVDLNVTGRDTLTVSGDVTVQEGSIEFGFNRGVSETTAPVSNSGGMKTAYSINARIDKVYFRNQFLDATLNGDMILQKFPSENRTRMGGELDVTDGLFNYWASVFVLDEGSLILDQFENNHELNFTARKSLSDGNEIIASITGELNDPQITFSDENNELSQSEIVRDLTVGEIASVLNETGLGDKKGLDISSATNALLALAEVPLEQQARKLAGVGGLDRIDIIAGPDGTYIDKATALVVGGRIGRNFYLTYEGAQGDLFNMEFEYRLNNKVSIVGSADDEKVAGAVRLRLQY